MEIQKREIQMELFSLQIEQPYSHVASQWPMPIGLEKAGEQLASREVHSATGCHFCFGAGCPFCF